MRSIRASRRPALLAVAAGGLLVVVAACGSDESARSPASGPAASAAERSGGEAVEAPADAPEAPAGTIAADGGSSDSAPVDASDPGAAPEVAATDALPVSSEPAPAATGDGAAATSNRYDDGGLDLVGAEVGGASDVETNPFPDLVVDDLNRGKQVNLRNAIPGERPVLLWFWAPH